MRYVYAAKPDYNPTTHNLYETYQLEDDVFRVDYAIQPKPDEDGYTPTTAEQPEGAPTLRQRLDVLEPTTDDLVEIIADQEYRLCLMELGITEKEMIE